MAGNVITGQTNHNLTAEHWKKIPDWIDNPAAIFDSETAPGSLVLIAPESYKGQPIRMIFNPNTKENNIEVHLLANAYNAQIQAPTARCLRDGLLRYIDKAKSRQFLQASGLQLPSTLKESRNINKRILVDSDLVKYRESNPAFSRSESNNGSPVENLDNKPYAQSLNRAMVRAIGDENWSKAYVTTDLLPSFKEFAEAATAAFGSKVTGIKPTARRFNILNGINYGGTNYINLDGDVSFINIIGHELYHDLEKQRSVWTTKSSLKRW